MSDEMYGDPQREAYYWEEQSQPEDCVEMSTADVVGQLTGDEPSERAITTLAYDTPSDAHSGDVYSPSGGTYLQDAQELLTHYGVSSQYYSDENPKSPSGVNVLVKALADGGKPIVAVDGPRIWDAIGDHGGPDPDTADHAVVVTGVDTQSGMVYLNDSGAPNGREEAVPIDVFMSAWATSGHSMVVADERHASPPEPSRPSTQSSTHDQTVDDPFVPASEEPQSTTSVATDESDAISPEDEAAAVLAALGVVGVTMEMLHRKRGRTAGIPPS